MTACLRPAAALAAAILLLAGCGGDDGERLPDDPIVETAPTLLRVSSPAFTEGSRLAEVYTCDGEGREPEITVGSTPTGTKELVLVVSDPDAPGGTFVHLTRFGISPRARTVADGDEGRNSAGKTGWTPPCPPEGDDPHRYVWTVYGLRAASGLEPGAEPSEVTAKVRGSVLAQGDVSARYGR